MSYWLLQSLSYCAIKVIMHVLFLKKVDTTIFPSELPLLLSQIASVANILMDRMSLALLSNIMTISITFWNYIYFIAKAKPIAECSGSFSFPG